VHDKPALGELHEARKSNANQRLEACILCPLLTQQASILTRITTSKLAIQAEREKESPAVGSAPSLSIQRFQHQFGDFFSVVVARSFQSVYDVFPPLTIVILAQLLLALDTFDVDSEANGGIDQFIDKIGGGGIDGPRSR
jgi:hypothetical protein